MLLSEKNYDGGRDNADEDVKCVFLGILGTKFSELFTGMRVDFVFLGALASSHL